MRSPAEIGPGDRLEAEMGADRIDCIITFIDPPQLFARFVPGPGGEVWRWFYTSVEYGLFGSLAVYAYVGQDRIIDPQPDPESSLA